MVVTLDFREVDRSDSADGAKRTGLMRGRSLRLTEPSKSLGLMLGLIVSVIAANAET